jgi:hypothetical protein
MGNIDIMPKNIHSRTKEEVKQLLKDKAQLEINRVKDALTDVE